MKANKISYLTSQIWILFACQGKNVIFPVSLKYSFLKIKTKQIRKENSSFWSIFRDQLGMSVHTTRLLKNKEVEKNNKLVRLWKFELLRFINNENNVNIVKQLSPVLNKWDFSKKTLYNIFTPRTSKSNYCP